MEKKRGRTNVYDTVIEPNFPKIKEMIMNGEEDKFMYASLGMSKKTWFKYKKEKSDFADLFKSTKDEMIERNTNLMNGWLVDENVSVSDKLKTIEYIEKTRGKMMSEKDIQYFAMRKEEFYAKKEIQDVELELKRVELERSKNGITSNVMQVQIVESVPNE